MRKYLATQSEPRDYAEDPGRGCDEAVASRNRLPAGYEAGICGREGKGVKKDAFKYFMKNSVPALIYANRERNPRAAAGATARAVRMGREKCSSRNPT